MKNFVETVIGGTVGIIALYVVARVAYHAGQEVAREECRYQNLREESERMEQEKKDARIIQMHDEPIRKETAIVQQPVRKKSRMDGLLRVVGIFGKRAPVIGHLVENPEDHEIEAFVEDNELHVNVRRRNA